MLLLRCDSFSYLRLDLRAVEPPHWCSKVGERPDAPCAVQTPTKKIVKPSRISARVETEPVRKSPGACRCDRDVPHIRSALRRVPATGRASYIPGTNAEVL